MIIRHYVTESILYILASNMDRGIKDYQLEAAIAKIVASVSFLKFYLFLLHIVVFFFV